MKFLKKRDKEDPLEQMFDSKKSVLFFWEQFIHSKNFLNMLRVRNVVRNLTWNIWYYNDYCTVFYNLKMPYLKFFLLTALVSTIICQAQVQLPVSNCLNNCYGCKATDPLNCATVVDNSINRQVRCIPYYSGDNCSIGGSFYVLLVSLRICMTKVEFLIILWTGLSLLNLLLKHVQ